MLGPHPLLGDVNLLQDMVDLAFKHNLNRQRAIAAKLNQMRKWFGITQDTLALEKKTKKEVRHVNDGDFEKILAHVRPYHNVQVNRTVPADVLRDFYRVCYASGARQSEAFALGTSNVKGNGVFIDSQIRRKEKFKSNTKTGKPRRAMFLDDGVESLKRWVAFTGKEWVERGSLSRNIKSAAKKAFPNNPEKWICVHDLRHSYAIRLIRDYDFSLTQVSKFLGNSIVVCEDYYANFVISDEMVEILYQNKIMNKKSHSAKEC